MDIVTIISEFQIGMIMIGLNKPKKIIISTYDLDLTLFLLEFYDPDIEYDIWYCLIINKINNIPFNIHLHNLNNNHCKFWYIESNNKIRMIITSTNLTNLMVHNCLQSFCSITVNNSNKKALEINDYKNNLKQFFDIFNIELELNIFKELNNKIIFNIPNKCNGIEKWFKLQKEIIIDVNNINGNYLKEIKKKLIIRNNLPKNNYLICYYNIENNKNINTEIINIPFNKNFHYKLYYSNKYVLLSSNNFSYNHKKNFELGILINETSNK